MRGNVRILSLDKSRQKGQALLEYALLLTVAATLSLGFLTTFSKIFGDKGITVFNAVLESELRTGSFENPTVVELWDN